MINIVQYDKTAGNCWISRNNYIRGNSRKDKTRGQSTELLISSPISSPFSLPEVATGFARPGGRGVASLIGGWNSLHRNSPKIWHHTCKFTTTFDQWITTQYLYDVFYLHSHCRGIRRLSGWRFWNTRNMQSPAMDRPFFVLFTLWPLKWKSNKVTEAHVILHHKICHCQQMHLPNTRLSFKHDNFFFKLVVGENSIVQINYALRGTDLRIFHKGWLLKRSPIWDPRRPQPHHGWGWGQKIKHSKHIKLQKIAL